MEERWRIQQWLFRWRNWWFKPTEHQENDDKLYIHQLWNGVLRCFQTNPHERHWDIGFHQVMQRLQLRHLPHTEKTWTSNINTLHNVLQYNNMYIYIYIRLSRLSWFSDSKNNPTLSWFIIIRCDFCNICVLFDCFPISSLPAVPCIVARLPHKVERNAKRLAAC